MAALSALMVGFLLTAVDWGHSLVLLRDGVSPLRLLPFALLAVGIALVYGWRWRMLLGRSLAPRSALVAALLCLGGNMFLPARGGDLLRLQFSHRTAKLPHAELVSRLFLEKVVDLMTIAAVGVIAALLLRDTLTRTSALSIMTVTGTALLAALAAVVATRFFAQTLTKWLRRAFLLARKPAFFDTHVAPMILDASQRLAVATLLAPALLTMAMWLLFYATSYMAAASFVGVSLTYPEALLVLFAGALGLMVPAAPSGIGTFHASVTSAFLLLQRTAAEGLLVATVIHLLFFVVYVAPGLALYSRWQLGARRTRQTP